ncbi:MAG: thioredoxin domain-containing protein [Melioribacteraceae bacterium]|nr:thioredoxin domain-containing protein [Melioribacteraceae bacterium]
MQKSNRLINEKSPYLLQHAHNPVDWFPWSDEAFEKAAAEDKPIFLSIGYSTCHWCHVMEKESFEDEEVAGLMNRVFVSIKVDREERPDIDNIYMMVCQLMNGNGGWPLSIIMTPDRKPFFAGTYFPKENRYGRIGFKELVKNIEEAWKSKRNEIFENSEQITGYLKNIYKKESSVKIDEKILERAFDNFSNRFDETSGGFGVSPKFPSPHNLMFLLRYWKRSGDQKALNMVTKTLTQMQMGGIYDHIGLGFHRYSTDKEWLVPHFEKMLYDQALLIIAYSEAYQATKNELFKTTVEEIIEYLIRDMQSEEGGFYSAEDADSEGEEGKFYVWKHDDIIEAIGGEDAEFIISMFNIKKEGNFLEESTKKLTGANILHLTKSYDELAEEVNLSTAQFVQRVNSLRQKLFEYRKKRIHPFKDDKILTDWNSLLIAALSIAGRAFNNTTYSNIAAACADFILSKMRTPNNELLHMYRNGKASIEGNLDDYAFFIYGLIELYQSTFEARYILEAIRFCDFAINKFWDEENSGFFFASGRDRLLLVRTKEIYDGAIPSGNSVMFNNLLRLSRITSDHKYENYAQKLLDAFSDNINRAPAGSAFLLASLDFTLGNSYEIIIQNKENNKDLEAVISEFNNHFIPNKVVITKTDTTRLPFEYLNNYSSDSALPIIYVCKNFQCELPRTDIEEAISLLT